MKSIQLYLLKLACLAALFAMPAYGHEPSSDPSPTATPHEEPSPTATPHEEPSPTATPHEEPSPTATPHEEPSPTATPRHEPSPTATPHKEPSPTATPRHEPSPTATPHKEPSPTATPHHEPSPTPKPSPGNDHDGDDHDGDGSGHGELSLHGFYRGTTSAGGIVLIYIEKNTHIQINVLDLAGQTIGFAEGQMTNGAFSFALSNGQNITGTAGERLITGMIAGASFQAERASEFGQDHKVVGRFTGVANGPTGESRVMFVLDAAGHIAMIQKSGTPPNVVRVGGFGTVTAPVAPATNYTFTLNHTVGSATDITGSFTITDGVFSGTFTTDAGTFTVNGFKTTVLNRMANISTRGLVGTGQGQLIGGFIITGGPKLVIIRAIGPSLTAFGVSPALDNPKLQLFAKQTLLGANDDWKTNSNVASIVASGLAPTNDLEAALLVRLEPGAYTTVVSGAADSAVGIGLVEVYEVGNE